MKRRDSNANAADEARPAATPGEVWRPRSGGFAAQSVAALIPRITRKSFEKHGFAAASLIMDWDQIVGREHARDTRPLKLKWPRGVETFAETDDGARGRPGATLVLQVDPAVALDMQYQSAQIIERINAYFGYGAVARLQIVQEAIADQHPPAAPPGEPAQEHSETEDGQGETDPLAAALARLGRHIRNRRSAGRD